MQHYYSDFWLGYAAGRIRLSAECRDRDVAMRLTTADPLEALPMEAWLRLPTSEHARVVGEYTGNDRPLQLPRTIGAVRGWRRHQRVATEADT